MRSKSIVFSSVIIAVVAIAAIAGALAYASQTQNTDNEIDSVYSVLYISDYEGSGLSPAKMLEGYTGTISGRTQLSASDIYVNYKDTIDQTDDASMTTSESNGTADVDGNRYVLSVDCRITGLDHGLVGSYITLTIGGSKSVGVVTETNVSSAECRIIGCSFTTVQVSEGDFECSYKGRISLEIQPYSSCTVSSHPVLTMTAHHTETVAGGSLSIVKVEASEEAPWTSTLSMDYINTPSTGADMAVLKGEAVTDAYWEDGTVIMTVYDSIRGTYSSESVITADNKWTANAPIRLTNGTFQGSIFIEYIPDDGTTTALDGKSVKFTLYETTETEVV